MMLSDGLDLEQVHEDKDPNLYIQNGVKRGVPSQHIQTIVASTKVVFVRLALQSPAIHTIQVN
jgi:hypothetical protein